VGSDQAKSKGGFFFSLRDDCTLCQSRLSAKYRRTHKQAEDRQSKDRQIKTVEREKSPTAPTFTQLNLSACFSGLYVSVPRVELT